LAYEVSADENVVIGMAQYTTMNDRAFRWTSAGGMKDLGTLEGKTSSGMAKSADSSVIVGYSTIAGTGSQHAFRWTSARVRDLGTIGGPESFATGVSPDGSTVLGYSYTSPTNTSAPHATLYTASQGTVDLNTALPALGINLTGWVLSQAKAMSVDRSVIVGVENFHGDPRAFLVTLCLADFN